MHGLQTIIVCADIGMTWTPGRYDREEKLYIGGSTKLPLKRARAFHMYVCTYPPPYSLSSQLVACEDSRFRR